MRGQLYIDGVDAYEAFGVWITEGGYDDFLSFPALVAPDKNVWPEEDGIDVDLSSPALSGKEISISFVASDPQIDVDEFISYVARPGYRTIRVPALGREWRLRLLSHHDNVVYGSRVNRLVSFSLRFADDFPMRVAGYLPADGGGIALPPSAYSLDGGRLDRYGMMIEEGRDSILKSAAVRQNLTRKFNSTDGVSYDADHLVFSEKDVTFKCCLITDTIERFWQCYIAFFNNLIQPGERLLGFEETGKNYKCYYKSTSGWKSQGLSGRIIVEFNLTLVFTSFRVSGNITYLLATEDGTFVSTEDDSHVDVSLTRPVLPASYIPALNVSEPAPASSSGEETEIRRRKITEMPEAGSLDNLIVPAVDRATNRNVHVPVSRLGGGGGIIPPPVFQSLSIIGRFDTYETLVAALPGGPAVDGICAVGPQPPYDYYAWSQVDGLWRWDNQGRLQMPEAYLRLFREIKVQGDSITINVATTRYAMVRLSGDSPIHRLSLVNLRDGDEGHILVYQTGFKQVSLPDDVIGTIDLPLKDGTVAMLIYNRIGDRTYIRTQTILGDTAYPSPQRVNDFQVTYSDSSSCTVQWTAPWANNIYDRGTAYDIRYANSLVDADDPKTWAGLRKVTGTPEPATPGTLQRMTISGLSPNKEYYVYLKTVKVNSGVEYSSPASDFAYFRTTGSEDMGRAYRIRLTERNLVPQLKNYLVDADGTVCSAGRMVDETASDILLTDGYPDTTNRGYATYWLTYKYGRDTSPFHIYVDLDSGYLVDKIFLYTSSKNNLSVWGMRDIGYAWEKAGEINIVYNGWGVLDLKGSRCRYIRLSWDLMDFGGQSTSPVMPEGSTGFPEPEYNGTIEKVNNLMIYGRPASNRPEGIMAPLRRSAMRKSVDQFLCTNGHAYQQGRIHSMCSGERTRMYIHFGQFAQFDQSGGLTPLTRLADMRFRVSQIPWVSGNDGTGDSLEDNLRNTYLRYGLKPYLCSTGVFDYCLYDRSVSTHNRPVDAYWYPGAWRPVPSRGVGGLDKYLGVTTSATSYKTYAKLCQALAAKYGKVRVDGSGLFWPLSESTDTGLDLISGIEPENEPDQNWSGWIGYTRPEEYASVISASADGHSGTLTDEDGAPLAGIRSGGILTVGSGTASVNRGYLLPALLHWKATRPDATIPADAFSTHMYFSNVGNQGSSQAAEQYGITLEEALRNDTGGELPRVCALRDRMAPDKEIWLTEFGWGESGARGTQSKYQCYSLPGRVIGGWTIPDRHRSDVKGAWIVRACVQLMAMGVDMVNYYSTECENNYFGAGRYDSGAGFEMFHWNDCPDPTPGARVEAIKPYECAYARGGFATTGLFGQILGNGAYPITRAYWWVATLRNRLKDYVYTGMRYLEADSRIVVACLKRRDGNKGAYVVYLNDNQNTGLEGVEIPVPDGVSSYRHVTVYVPDIPNPADVPSSLGWDKERTGLPTSRKERYVGGKWVIQNRPYYQDRHMSYALSPVDYPENPAEGDEITVLPTGEENPWFPIVGPVQAKQSPRKNTLSAQQYEQDRENWQDGPRLDADGNPVWTVKANAAYSWRQVNAVCDYIDFHPEGIRGRMGDQETREVIRGMIRTNVSEFPEIYLFDAEPDPDYRSEVTDLSSRTVSSSAVELWWNNTSVEDTGYEIFVSDLPEVGYTPLKRVGIGVENKAVISGLSPDTTSYYKVRPVRGDKTGTMSDHVSARTFRDLQPPADLRVERRTATSIRLAWDYDAAQVADFMGYALYRSDDTGAYAQVGTVPDQSVHAYEDTGLAVGRVYRYKARAVGLNGMSPYTAELETRTLLPEEVSPVLRSAMTDKLGGKVTLSFDLPLGVVPATAKSGFTLSEDGNLRLVKSVYRDEANHNDLVLSIPQNSLSDYDQKTDIRVSYDGKGGILSEYGITLEGFTGVRVANVIGNYTDLNAIYQVNLCAPGAAPVPDWNNLEGESDKPSSITALVDTYGRVSGVSVARVHDGTAYKWGNVTPNGHCEIEGIPADVYRSQWGVAHGNNNAGSVKSRLVISGLGDERRYTVKAYGGTVYGSAIAARMRIGDVLTPVLQQLGNKTGMMAIEDITPTDGEIKVDIINPVEGLTSAYSVVGFLIIEEYKSGDSPENTDVWLREATVLEDDGNGVVKSPDVTIHLNCVGKATHYRVGETGDMSSTPWVGIVGDVMDVPYTLSPGFGPKILYAQVKNQYNESNVRVINVEYKDPYVPLSLKNIYVNDDDAVTYDRPVTVMMEIEGAPTHYKISETADLAGADWVAWQGPVTPRVGYTLSDGAGMKTVYAQVRDGLTESAVRVDTIRFVVLTKATGTITIPLPDGITDAGQVNISIAPLKYDKRFAFGYSVDDTSMQTYSVVQALFAGKWIDDADFCHLGAARTTGHTPGHPLYYTDGLGTKRYFAVSNYLITLRSKEQYSHHPLEGSTGASNPYLRFDELKAIQDLDGEWMIHNVDETVWDKTDPRSIARGMLEVNDYMEANGVGRSIMSSTPDGNENYPAAALACDDIRAICRERGAGTNMDVLAVKDLEKLQTPRYFMNDMSVDNLRGVLARTTDNSVLGLSAHWGSLGSHRPRGKVGVDDGDWNNIREVLEFIYTAYGAAGTDEVWFANDSEVYQYLYLKRHTSISKRIEGGDLVVTVEMPRFEGLKWFETTLLLDIEAGAASCDDGIYGFTSGMNNGRFMINVNMMDSLVERAERYTSRFEASEESGDLDDARYFIQRLKPSLRQPYLQRIDALASPPSLVSFDIRAAETAVPEITCDYAITGKATHYMMSEAASFAGAEWIVITPSPLSFRLSSVAGGHTVHFKVKNAFGESQVLSDTVTYNPPAFGLSSITINGGAASTTDKTLSVAFDVTGVDTPMRYIISEVADFSGADWMDYRNPAPFTVSGTGARTLYAKVRSGDRTSGVASASIRVSGMSAALSFGWDHTSGAPLNGSVYDASLGVTKVRLGSNQEAATINIYDRNGERMGTFTDVSGYTTGGPLQQGNVTGNDTGVFPDGVLSRNVYKNPSVSQAGMTISIPDGMYKIRILVNTKQPYNLVNASYTLQSAGVRQSFAMRSSYVDNFHDLSELTVNVVGGVTLTMSTTDVSNTLLPLNVIEIERV